MRDCAPYPIKAEVIDGIGKALSATAREDTMNETVNMKDENCGFNFCLGNPHREIMRLDAEGMTYKGQRIEDAGEAHRAFLETMRLMQGATAREVGE
jgi:hypothetical protein